MALSGHNDIPIAIGWSTVDIISYAAKGQVVMPKGKPFPILDRRDNMILFVDDKGERRFVNKEDLIWHDPTKRLSETRD